MSPTLIAVILAGTVVEWCEYALYLYLGYRLSSHFFPANEPGVALLLSFSVFATGYVFRPLGAYFYGAYSDKYGRKPPVFVSIFMIGVATALIGVLPSYAQVGVLAPILLVMLRIIQSLSIAGEFNNTAIYLTELTATNKTLASALVGAAASLGMFLGGMLALGFNVHPSTCMWRVAFIGLGLLSLWVCLQRRKLQESPLFVVLQQQRMLSAKPLREVVSKFKLGLVRIFMLSSFLCVYVYTCGGFYAVYLAKVTTINAQEAMLYCSLSQLLIAILMPIIAMKFEKNHSKLLKLGVLGFIWVAPLMFYCASTPHRSLLMALLLGYALCNSLCSVAILRAMYDALPTAVRCTGVSVFYNLAAAVFGGTAPMLAQFFINNNAILLPGFYVGLMGLLSLLTVVVCRAKTNELANMG